MRQDVWWNGPSVETVCRDREIPMGALRVWLYLSTKITVGNCVRLTRRRIACELGMHESNVSRAIGLLLRKGVIARLDTNRRAYNFMANPAYIWKGKLEDIDRGVRKFETLKKLSVVGSKRANRDSK